MKNLYLEDRVVDKINASKEEATRALVALETLEKALLGGQQDHVAVLRQFILVSQRKLPTEAAYKRDKKRRRVAKVGS